MSPRPAISEALGLFPSCIKSGESWSATCQDVLNRAQADLTQIRALVSQPEGELLDRISSIGDLVGVPRPPHHESAIVMGPGR